MYTLIRCVQNFQPLWKEVAWTEIFIEFCVCNMFYTWLHTAYEGNVIYVEMYILLLP
jgi:hypothetical protein